MFHSVHIRAPMQAVAEQSGLVSVIRAIHLDRTARKNRLPISFCSALQHGPTLRKHMHEHFS